MCSVWTPRHIFIRNYYLHAMALSGFPYWALKEKMKYKSIFSTKMFGKIAVKAVKIPDERRTYEQGTPNGHNYYSSVAKSIANIRYIHIEICERVRAIWCDRAHWASASIEYCYLRMQTLCKTIMLIKLKMFELERTGRIQFNFKIEYEKEIVIQHSSMHKLYKSLTMEKFEIEIVGLLWMMNVECWTGHQCSQYLTISSSTMKPWNHGEKQV